MASFNFNFSYMYLKHIASYIFNDWRIGYVSYPIPVLCLCFIACKTSLGLYIYISLWLSDQTEAND